MGDPFKGPAGERRAFRVSPERRAANIQRSKEAADARAETVADPVEVVSTPEPVDAASVEVARKKASEMAGGDTIAFRPEEGLESAQPVSELGTQAQEVTEEVPAPVQKGLLKRLAGFFTGR
ncbi:hypothetical protein HOI18_02650 [Candidatus Uhrbacteria bacterium]|jgi:hypothetical protein|nr:hypothetical protein [Candidatus Uhrbacteria bacterium]